MNAIFIDKDGTLIENRPYNVDPEQIVLTPGAGEALAALQSAGYRIIVISNQPGVALGRFPFHALLGVKRRLDVLLAHHGVTLVDFFFCPHHPDGVVSPFKMRCSCRKPEPGMLLEAARKHQIYLGASWFIGDILNDVEAGRRAGCRTLLIDNGNETEWKRSPLRTPHHRVSTMIEAAEVILRAAAVERAAERCAT